MYKKMWAIRLPAKAQKYITEIGWRFSRTSAHSHTTTVAPFRAWRGLQRTVAKGPNRHRAGIDKLTPKHIALKHDGG